MSPIAASRNARIEAAITISKAIRQIKNIPTKRSARQRPKTVRNFFPPELFLFCLLSNRKRTVPQDPWGLPSFAAISSSLYPSASLKSKCSLYSSMISSASAILYLLSASVNSERNSFFCYNSSSSNNFLTDFANLRYSVLSSAYSSLPSSVSE